MSGDSQAALARAAAEIADLKTKLNQANIQVAEAKQNTSAAHTAATKAQTETTAAIHARDEWKDKYNDVARQLADINSSIEPGITKQTMFVTAGDGTVHRSMNQARRHLVRSMLGITESQMDSVLVHGETVMGILQRINASG
jgi:chromosome segregation ATPase